MPLPWAGRMKRHWPTQAEPQTAWQGAQTVYERYRRDPEVRATWWKVAALLSILSGCVLGVALIGATHRPPIEPYYVYVTNNGTVLGAEKISTKPYNVEEEVLRHLVQEWLQWVRAVPLDAAVLKENWRKAMAMSTAPVAQRLYAYAKAIDLTALAKRAQGRELAVQITVESILMLSERTLRVVWREAVFDGANVERENNRFSGEFEVIMRKPGTQEEFDANPLGFWIARFTWAKDLL